MKSSVFFFLSFQTSTFGFNLFTRFLLFFSRCFASPFKEPARGWSSPKTLTRHLSDCMPIFSIRKTRTSCCCSLFFFSSYLFVFLSLYTHTHILCVYKLCLVLAQTDRQTPSRDNPEVSEKKKGKNPILFGKSSTCPTLSRSRNQTKKEKR